MENETGVGRDWSRSYWISCRPRFRWAIRFAITRYRLTAYKCEMFSLKNNTCVWSSIDRRLFKCVNQSRACDPKSLATPGFRHYVPGNQRDTETTAFFCIFFVFMNIFHRLLMKPGTSRVYFLYAHVSPTHPHTHTQAGTCKTLTSRVIGARCVGVRARVCVSMGVWFLISEQTQMGRRNRHGLSHWSSRSRAFLFLRFTR